MSDSDLDMQKNAVNEPEERYVNHGRLTFYRSLDEENEAQYQYWMRLSPEERLEEHRKLSLIIFANSERYTGNRLIFD